MGSAGTIAAGDAIKARIGAKIVGLEPVQCPTLYRTATAGTRIEGIGDKHVTWIHNVGNMDAMMCIDDEECLLGLQLLTEPRGPTFSPAREGSASSRPGGWLDSSGVSGICNMLGANQDGPLARALQRRSGRDRGDRRLRPLPLGDEAARRADRPADPRRARGEYLARIFHRQKLDWIAEGTRENRERWHNLKYFTWVEQQGKNVEELEAQRSNSWWRDEAAVAENADRRLREARGW